MLVNFVVPSEIVELIHVVQTFGTTFGPQAAGAVSILGGLADGRTTAMIVSAIASALVGGAMLVL